MIFFCKINFRKCSMAAKWRWYYFRRKKEQKKNRFFVYFHNSICILCEQQCMLNLYIRHKHLICHWKHRFLASILLQIMLFSMCALVWSESSHQMCILFLFLQLFNCICTCYNETKSIGHILFIPRFGRYFSWISFPHIPKSWNCVGIHRGAFITHTYILSTTLIFPVPWPHTPP